MSQTSDDDDEDDDGQRLWRLGEHRGRDFPISPIDEVGRTRRACVRLLVFITQLTAMRTWWAIRNSWGVGLANVEGQESYHYDDATLLSAAAASAESIRCDRDVIFASGGGGGLGRLPVIWRSRPPDLLPPPIFS